MLGREGRHNFFMHTTNWKEGEREGRKLYGQSGVRRSAAAVLFRLKS